MSSASLIPDRQLTFSPELAETIGLEEAVLLQALGSLLENNQRWTTVRMSQLQHTLYHVTNVAGHVCTDFRTL